jgi:VCBS repeat-containing protein
MLTVNPNVIGGDSTEGTITWSFSSGSETFDYLAAGESLVLTYTITVTDSSGATDTQNVTITINGTNDAPAVSLVGDDSAMKPWSKAIPDWKSMERCPSPTSTDPTPSPPPSPASPLPAPPPDSVPMTRPCWRC